jgi:alpha-D-xyloside xylohydrolase
MIVIDWFHWKNMGDWSLNPQCWPDPKAMVDELRALGIELMITTWPFMGMPFAIFLFG